MRYLISKSFASTAPGRQKYLFDSVHLWTTRAPEKNGFITLESMPTCSLDVFFIMGHNYEVEYYLTHHLASITETTIVAITCGARINLSTVKNSHKQIYLTRQRNNNTAELLLGSKYGFLFDLTESEIIFYTNVHLGDLFLRLDNAFTKLN